MKTCAITLSNILINGYELTNEPSVKVGYSLRDDSIFIHSVTLLQAAKLVDAKQINKGADITHMISNRGTNDISDTIWIIEERNGNL